MHETQIQIPQRELSQFCRRWLVTELALFGSVLRTDFNPDSDIDVLITFDPRAAWSLYDLVRMQDELEAIFGRRVDLVEKDGLNNPYRRRHILGNMAVIYTSG